MANEYSKLIIPFLIMSIVTAVLLYLAYNAWRGCRLNNKTAKEMPQWPTVSALAKEWCVYRAGTGRWANYTAEITYIYRMKNKDYQIDVPEKKFEFDSRDDPKHIVEAAKQEAEAFGRAIVNKGKKIKIYYNPKEPSKSSAEILTKRSCVPIFIVVLFLSIFFLVLTLLSLGALGLTVFEIFS